MFPLVGDQFPLQMSRYHVTGLPVACMLSCGDHQRLAARGHAMAASGHLSIIFAASPREVPQLQLALAHAHMPYKVQLGAGQPPLASLHCLPALSKAALNAQEPHAHLHSRCLQRLCACPPAQRWRHQPRPANSPEAHSYKGPLTAATLQGPKCPPERCPCGRRQAI